MNGQRANANYFMVDGMSWNFSIFGFGQAAGGTIPAFTIDGTTHGLVPVDAMQEFRVLTSSFSPEFGRTPGAQISIVTRSGTNGWHGTAFDHLRNDAISTSVIRLPRRFPTNCLPPRAMESAPPYCVDGLCTECCTFPRRRRLTSTLLASRLSLAPTKLARTLFPEFHSIFPIPHNREGDG